MMMLVKPLRSQIRPRSSCNIFQTCQ